MEYKLFAIENMNVSLRENRSTYEVCSGVSLTVGRGETVSIIGESGCGKSVTCLAALGLLSRSKWEVSGEVYLSGERLNYQSEKCMTAVRGDRIGYVAQDPGSAFDQRLTIGRHFAEVRGNRGLSRSEVIERSVRLLERLYVRDPYQILNSYSFQLSGGMLQRVMLAVALSSSPDIIIADEPTTALDVTNRREMIRLLVEMQKEKGIAVLLVSHDLNMVAGISDTIYVMYAGAIVEQGQAAQVSGSSLHPYTQALLSARPAFSKARLQELKGRPPSIYEKKQGCSFYDRCAYRQAAACQESVELEPAGDNHWVRCVAARGRCAHAVES